MKKLIVLLLPIALMATSCRWVGAKRVKGNGNLKTENRSVSSFAGVESFGSYDVYVSVGTQHAVRIEAEENLLPFIEVWVDGDVLKVKSKDGFWLSPKRDIKVFITAPDYRRIYSYGSGNINGETKVTGSGKIDLGVAGSANINLDIDAPEIEGDISGSGNMSLKGTTKKFDGQIAGSGNIYAMELQSEETKVKIMGSGNADVFASIKLDVNVSGSGDIRYKGGAQVNSNIAGSGNVMKVD